MTYAQWMSAEDRGSLRNQDPVLMGELWRIFCDERTHTRKEVAARMGKAPDCLDRWINGRDVLASQIAPLYYAVGEDIRIYTALLRGTGLVVSRLPAPRASLDPFRLVERLLIHLGAIHKILGKINAGEKITADELQELEVAVAEKKATLDEALVIARQSVRKQGEQK